MKAPTDAGAATFPARAFDQTISAGPGATMPLREPAVTSPTINMPKPRRPRAALLASSVGVLSMMGLVLFMATRPTTSSPEAIEALPGVESAPRLPSLAQQAAEAERAERNSAQKKAVQEAPAEDDRKPEAISPPAAGAPPPPAAETQRPRGQSDLVEKSSPRASGIVDLVEKGDLAAALALLRKECGHLSCTEKLKGVEERWESSPEARSVVVDEIEACARRCER